ncbi:hypothetical protein [Moheibacter sediminis]|uniref:Uncharacterized protein n=1 Tax=Moheibacter sediminis TaxID=1434700 RepID=A0A1W2B4Q6_9FLAO|nr:hypothetical protein [Moheibacter sediminis]SMC67967.1 hypothetical protein SAMN06296427_105268 [Moheibacter sediminis]
MNYSSIAEKIIDLKNTDLALLDKLIQSRQLSNGYNEEMQELHNRNAGILNEIIDAIGYENYESKCRLPYDQFFIESTLLS